MLSHREAIGYNLVGLIEQGKIGSHEGCFSIC